MQLHPRNALAASHATVHVCHKQLRMTPAKRFKVRLCGPKIRLKVQDLGLRELADRAIDSADGRASATRSFLRSDAACFTLYGFRRRLRIRPTRCWVRGPGLSWRGPSRCG